MRQRVYATDKIQQKILMGMWEDVSAFTKETLRVDPMDENADTTLRLAKGCIKGLTRVVERKKSKPPSPS
jgi:hypothetical protein